MPQQFKKGDKRNFLDYQIIFCENNDGIVLRKHPDRPQELYECHLGNFSSLDSAQKAAVIYFMLARPEKFATQMFYKATCGNKSGCSSEWFAFKRAVLEEGFEMPEEITPVDSLNFLVGYKGNFISFK